MLADDPALTCRLPGMIERSPVRVVLDRDLRIAPTCGLAASARATPVWVVTGPDAPAERERALVALGVKVIRVTEGEGGLDPVAALKALASRGVTRLLVEGGPKVAASFLKADLVDEAALLRGPATIGPSGIDALDGLPLHALTRSPRLTPCGRQALGQDTIEYFERS